MTRSLLWRLILIATLAVGVRLVYQAGMDWVGGSYNNGSDSEKYINAAGTIVATGQFATTSRDGRLEPATNRLPVYLNLVAAIFKLSNSENLRLVVTIQALLEFFSVLAIGLAGAAISERVAIPAALMAALIPNFIVQTSYILTESVFLVPFTLGICAMLWAVRSERPFWMLVATGICFGIALITRLALVYYGFVLVPVLFYALMTRSRGSWLKNAGLAVTPLICMWAIAAPLVIQNYVDHGYAALSSQSGAHMLYWFYACLATPVPCAGRLQILAELTQLQNAEIARMGEPLNNFALSAWQSRLAMERMMQLPLTTIASSMTLGVLKSLLQTGFYEVLTQFKQPATFFSMVKGDDLPSRFLHFITLNRANVFMMMWAAAEFLLAISRGFQLYGLFQGIRIAWLRPYAALLFITAAYFITITGPVANPRYRIPAEPPLILFFAIGFVSATDRYRAWKAAKLGAPAPTQPMSLERRS